LNSSDLPSFVKKGTQKGVFCTKTLHRLCKVTGKKSSNGIGLGQRRSRGSFQREGGGADMIYCEGGFSAGMTYESMRKGCDGVGRMGEVSDSESNVHHM